jgi:hypothetical protein
MPLSYETLYESSTGSQSYRVSSSLHNLENYTSTLLHVGHTEARFIGDCYNYWPIHDGSGEEACAGHLSQSNTSLQLYLFSSSYHSFENRTLALLYIGYVEA